MSQNLTNPISTGDAAIAPLELTVSGPGWDGGERHAFEQPFVLVGRDEHNCLRLDDDAVSRRHAYLQQIGDRVFCIDLGSRTGTRWAGESRPTGWLRPNQGIQIGPFTIDLAHTAWNVGAPHDEGAEAGNPLLDRINDHPQLPRFSIGIGNEVRTPFRMNRELVLVGTSPDCRVRLRDVGISRYHCSLVKTPDGVWVVDLLSGTGTRLNGQPIRWARMNEGDLLRIGPYVLRLGYEGESVTPSTILPEDQAEQRGNEASKSEQISDRAPALQAELDQLREHHRDTETLRQQLADREAECIQLREQACVLENQAAQAAELRARLETTEAVARKLEEVCSERDHWRAEAQDLRNQIESDLAQREELRPQLETAQQQLAEEREAVRAAKVQLEQQSADLQKLRETHEELARAQEKARELQAELDQARQQHQDAEALRLQLEDVRGKHDELVVLVPELEGKASSADRLQEQLRDAGSETEQLREQLLAAESRLAELEALRTECAQLREQTRAFETQVAEMTDLKGRLESSASATLQQQQEIHEELVRAQDKTRELQAELDQARQHQQDAESLRQQLEDVRSKHEELNVRIPQLEDRAASVDHLQDRLRNADSETQRLREQLQAAESRLTELEALRTECVQLREQTRAFEIQVAEMTDLKGRLESAEADARKLEDIGRERDHWQAQTQTLQTQIESDLGEREELRRQLEEVQQQLAEEREAVRAANQNLDQHSATLQQLQEAHDELARAQDKTRELQAELDQARQHQQDAETLRQQLADVRGKHEELVVRVPELEGRATSVDALQDRLRNADEEAEQLRQQVRMLESQVAESADLIKARLEAAEADARQLEKVNNERDRWQTEAQDLRNRIASDLVQREQLDRLTADLHSLQAERDRLLTEQQAPPHELEQASARVSELERALTEATAAHEKALGDERAHWESERQTLKALIEQARSADNESTQAMVREAQTRSAAERDEWRLRLEGAEAQIAWERGLFQEQSEQLRRQVAALRADRDRLAARLGQVESSPAAEQRPPAKAVPSAEMDPMPQLGVQDRALALFCGIEVGPLPAQSARVQVPNKPAAQSRPHLNQSNQWPQGGQQVRQPSLDQGVEDAWLQAAAGWLGQTATPSKPDRAGTPEPEAGPNAGAENTGHIQSAQGTPPQGQADEEQPSNPSDDMQSEPAIAEEKNSGGHSQPKDEEQRGLFGKILNLVRRK